MKNIFILTSLVICCTTLESQAGRKPYGLLTKQIQSRQYRKKTIPAPITLTTDEFEKLDPKNMTANELEKLTPALVKYFNAMLLADNSN